jgi:quinone-modifying oxidoreductase, subunit QmoC
VTPNTAKKESSRTPGTITRTESELRSAFLKQVWDIPGGEKIKRCIQCGTCSGSCPVAYAMDLQPREIIALFRAGMIETILKSRSIWICASCYQCTERCPSGIKVTDIMYAMKRLAMDRKIYPDKFPVYVLSKSFVENVNRYGRNFEIGLMMEFYLKTDPMRLLKMAPMGIAMMKMGKLHIKPKRVRALSDLRKIIAKADTLVMPPEEFRKEYTEGMIGYGAVDRDGSIHLGAER